MRIFSQGQRSWAVSYRRWCNVIDLHRNSSCATTAVVNRGDGICCRYGNCCWCSPNGSVILTKRYAGWQRWGNRPACDWVSAKCWSYRTGHCSTYGKSKRIRGVSDFRWWCFIDFNVNSCRSSTSRVSRCYSVNCIWSN